ncbi:MAG: 7-cyano-7-deazaguanine synthase QueC [Phycisphaeraceae bacterium]|nr:7-cyano-7-deazaguanine synthase QueC [Phycisphaeraceae bacterium]
MNDTLPRPAVILLSGGLDSATVLAMASDQGFDGHALSFNYGQRHDVELAAARRIAEHFDVADHRVADIDLRAFGGSALTDNLDVPKDRSDTEIADGIPITYVPARNTIFLSYALGYAEVLGALDIFLGVNAVDYSGYPDCRPAFIESFQQTARLATRLGVEGGQLTIHAPLIDWPKTRIIEEGRRLGVDYGLTHSCYDPEDGEACGRCDACRLREQAFTELGLTDPVLR